MERAGYVLDRPWKMWIVSLGEELGYRMIGLEEGSRLSTYT